MSEIPYFELRGWLFQHALPLWASAGVDTEHGGFREELGPDALPTDVDYKRVRAMCRQTYVFSHAALIGWPRGVALSRRGYEFLASRVKLADGSGWARLLTREGEPKDRRQDLYDLGFLIFAMVWRYKLAREPAALEYALEVAEFIETSMRHGQGYWHMLPPEGPRQQNPHMHLFEATLAGYEASGDARFLKMAHGLADLFRERLFNGRTLGERFDENWNRLSDEHGLEPGHQFEWAWILSQYQKLTGVDVSREAAALVDFAEAHGVDPVSHAVYDAITEEGAPLRTSSRAWPNTERIKGWVALYELTGRDPRAAIASSARLLLDRYYAPAPRGSWIDQFDGRGRPMFRNAPASTLYHTMMAFTEVLRLEPDLG